MSDDARSHILGTLRRQLKRGPLDATQRGELERRLNQPRSNIIPARAQLPHAGQVELFVNMAQEAAASVVRVATLDAVPAAVAEFLSRHNLPPALVLAPAAELATLPWTESHIAVERRHAQDGDQVSVSPAVAGIAETGTLMLLSGPDSPTTLNFLPDVHIVILHAAHIVGPYEDAFTLLRERGQGMPRTVNFITGPSRSADIEQTLQMGAHGPIQVHIVLVQP